MTFLPLVVVLALILLMALYVSAEFGAVSVRRNRIRQRAEQGDGLSARLYPYIADSHRLDRYISASQIGITLTSLMVGAYAQATLTLQLVPFLRGWVGMQEMAARSVSTILVLAVLTTLQMVLGELVPKYYALHRPTEVARWTVIPMQWSLAVFGPFLRVLNGSAGVVLRLLGVSQAGHGHIHSPEEIDLLIAESRDGGLLEPDEQLRLRRALQLGVRPARHLMVPRPQIAAIDVETPVEEVMRIVAESPYTRLPVYRGTIDHITGFLHTRDLFTRRLDPAPITSVEPLIRPILIVPENVTADRLLTLMREERSHQAVVMDEFGGVAGLVTLDDVLQEVMGDITDEFKAAEPHPERMPDGRVRLPGLLRLDEAEPWIGIFLEGESDTVGGRVTEELGHLPEAGERVTIDGVEMEVEAVSGHAVVSVLAMPLQDQGATEDEEGGRG
jgi:CBS domain containing-hemolysin-like protein